MKKYFVFSCMFLLGYLKQYSSMPNFQLRLWTPMCSAVDSSIYGICLWHRPFLKIFRFWRFLSENRTLLDRRKLSNLLAYRAGEANMGIKQSRAQSYHHNTPYQYPPPPPSIPSSSPYHSYSARYVDPERSGLQARYSRIGDDYSSLEQVPNFFLSLSTF